MSTSADNSEFDQEQADAAKVNAAVELIAAGNHDEAESLLHEVCANTPADYENCIEEDGKLIVKFWDQESFLHYVLWHRAHGVDRDVVWKYNAYPRAFYLIGFICVKLGRFEKALEYLDPGQVLEPTQPRIAFERAQAYVRSGRGPEALELFKQYSQIGPHITGRHRAIALRAVGFLLIEMGELEQAERSFHESLKLDSGNALALNELEYIRQVRQGQSTDRYQSIQTVAPDLTTCARCGKKIDEGKVISLQGSPIVYCDGCREFFEE